MVEHAPPPDLAARNRRGLALLVAAQLVLALIGASHKSLVQDELHTRFHASAASLAELFANLRLDNHPPLGFLLVRAGRNLLGDSELALRAPLILCGLVGTLLVARLCARVGAPVLLGAAAWALGSTQLEFSTQSRMYGLSALCCIGALDAVARLAADGPVRLRDRAELALWVAAGLLTHYYWLIYAAALAAALVAVAALGARGRALFARAWPAGVAAGVLCLPWYLSTFRDQVASGLPPGMVRAGPLDLVEAWLHLFAWNVSVGGAALRIVFIAAAALAVALAALGVWKTWRGGRRELALVVAVLGFAVPPTAGLVAAQWGRMGFNWNYVLPSLPALVVAFAWGAAGAPSLRRAGALAVALGAVLSAFNAFAPASEGHRAAVRRVFEQWRAGDVLYVAERQGQVFEQGLAWDYYAPRMAQEFPSPQPVPRRATRWFDVEDAGELAGHARVLLQAKVADGMAITARLRELYPREERTTFGYGVEVWVFRPAASPD